MRIDFMGRDGMLRIIGDEKVTFLNRVMEKHIEDGTYFIKNSNIEGIFNYGFQQDKEDYFGNPAGYIWSSRAGVMNKLFDVALIEICYKAENEISYRSCAIDLAHLETILEGTNYEIDWTPREDKSDVRYRIVKRS